MVLELRDITDFQNLLKAIHYNLLPAASLRGDLRGSVVTTTLHLCWFFCLNPNQCCGKKKLGDIGIKKEKAKLSSFLGTVIKQKTQVIQWTDY